MTDPMEDYVKETNHWIEEHITYRIDDTHVRAYIHHPDERQISVGAVPRKEGEDVTYVKLKALEIAVCQFSRAYPISTYRTHQVGE